MHLTPMRPVFKRHFVEEQANIGGYSSASEYVRELIPTGNAGPRKHWKQFSWRR
jgi:hypothetical protein